MNYKLLGCLILIDLPMFYALFRTFFKDWEDLESALAYWITPSIVSAYRGEFWEDQWATLKLTSLFLICSGIVGGEYYWLATRHAELVARFFS